MSFPAATLQDGSLEFILFEPQNALVEELRLRCSLLPNFKILPFALSSRDFDGVLTIPPVDRSQSFLLSDEEKLNSISLYQSVYARTEDQNVVVRTVDSCIKEGLPEPDLIKIDTEGHVYEVLRGASTLLEKKPELILLFEGDLSWRLHQSEIVEMLKPRLVRRILANGDSIDAFADVDMEHFGFANYVACK